MGWGLIETLIAMGVFLFFILVGMAGAGIIELYDRFKYYKIHGKPVKKRQISPSEWKPQEESWEERIMRG